MAKPKGRAPASVSERLDRLAQEALSVAKKAKRHRKSLAGDNFYANKMATLQTDATNAFSEDLGHMSAHGRYFTAQKTDVDAAQPGCRVVVEEFLRHAGSL